MFEGADSRVKIKDVKKKIRHENWREEISECQSSGLKVKEWCRKKGLNTNTYYNRLRVIREEILALSESEVQEIVPVSISKEISVSDTENTASSTASVSERDKAVIRKGDIEIELPEKITQDMVLMFFERAERNQKGEYLHRMRSNGYEEVNRRSGGNSGTKVSA